MPVNSKHPQLQEYYPIYEMLENFYSGEQAVKKNAKTYVPMLSGQTPQKFYDYVSRGMFYNAFAKTIDALTGSTFNVSPAINLPKRLEYLRDDATGKGTSSTELAMALCVEALKTGRVGLFVDRPPEEVGGKPYLTAYDCDEIVNWRDGSFVVLKDNQLVPKEDDPYEFDEVEGYRELALIDGEYIVRIWRKKGKHSSDFQVVETYVPTRYGKPLNYIPFVFIGPNGLDSNVGRPPLLDLANVQRVHFACECDRANAIHVSCIPTPYITGFKPEEGYELKVGSDTVLLLEDATSKVGFLEFSGQGLNPVKEYLDKLEMTMAALGARVAEGKNNNKTLIETATGSRIRESLAVSTLGSILATVEAALNKCTKWAAEWEGADPTEVNITLNKELVSANMDANMVNALLQAVQAGQMSSETFYKKLADAGLTEPGVSFADETVRVKDNPPQPQNQTKQPTNASQDIETLDNTEKL